MRFGTLALRDMLARRDINILQYGEDKAVAEIRTSIEAHNALQDQLYRDVADTPPDRLVTWGGSTVKSHRPYRVNQHGRVDVGRGDIAVSTASLGFPLHRYQWALGFTRDYFERKSPADAAEKILEIQKGDADQFEYDLRTALFNPTNDTAYIDYLVDDVNIPLRALLNADGAYIPPNGNNTFDPNTHTHYVAISGLTATFITAAVTNLVEHGPVGAVEIWFNSADVSLLDSMAPFREYLQPGIRVVESPGDVLPTGTQPTLGPNVGNRAIGTWNWDYQVWSKDNIVPAGYFIVRDTGQPIVGHRVPADFPGAAGRGLLRTVADHEHFPLRAQFMEREYGFSIWNRASAVIGYFGGASYTPPTVVMGA